MNKNIIIAGAIAIGLYLFSQTKKITNTTTAQKVAPKRIGQPTTEAARIAALLRATAQKENISELPVQLLRYLIAHAAAQKKAGKEVAALRVEVARREAAYNAAVRKAAAQKIGKKIGKKVAQKVDISRLPVQQIRYMIAHAAAQKKTGKEVAALRVEVARREAAYNAAVRKAAAQKIGKKIGKTVAQKIPLNLKTRRAVIAQYAKRQRPQIQRPRPNKKQIASRLFSGAEKSRIIPYSESSKHSYYGPKSHKLQNEGYRVESNKRLANSVEANHGKVLMEVLSNPKLWKK